MAEDIKEGLIVRIKGSDYFVVTEDGEYVCILRGRFRIEDTDDFVLPVVGDRVRFRSDEEYSSDVPRGLILEILPRKSTFKRVDPSRRSRGRVIASNLDQVFLVFSWAEPEPNLRLLDRMLVAAESDGIEPVICVNKIDLAETEGLVRERFKVYSRLGYRLIFASARSGEGVDELRHTMKDKLSIMAGPSGTGKTSLISRIQPGLELKVRSVSRKSGKGRHTTAHFELHPLEEGGYIGDTPGVREFGIVGVRSTELSDYFRELREFSGLCRFPGCTHSHEPDCAVKEAVKKGDVDPERYESYIRILESLKEQERSTEWG